MVLSSKEALDVMAWADGELEGPDAAQIAALVEGNEDARELVRSLGALSELVRAVEVSSRKAPPNVANAVMSAIGSGELERARLKRGMRMRVGLAAAMVTALAASALLYRPVRNPLEPVGNNVRPPTAPEATGVEVGEVDAEDPVSVFYVAAENGTDTAIVWIDDSSSTTR